MLKYQKQALKLAGEILKDLNKPIYRICPGCGLATDELILNDGDRYGRVWHDSCYRRRGTCLQGCGG